MSGPTKPNRTQMSTASDLVMTPTHVAKWIVDHFNPGGICLDPCKGDGAFYNAMPCPKRWCEILEGRDFFEYRGPRVAWIITNPPYSIYDRFLEQAFNVSDNVVFFVPIAKAFKSQKIENLVMSYGGLAEILFMGGGGQYGFNFGFPVGCLHYKRHHKGTCIISHHSTETNGGHNERNKVSSLGRFS
jgi:hypothetical protein